MSWILTRRKNNCFQLFCSEDIYGNGKWLQNGEGSILDQPRQFNSQSTAQSRLKMEQKKEPDWEYEINYYE